MFQRDTVVFIPNLHRISGAVKKQDQNRRRRRG
jgi:hypothetical protein